MNERIRQLAEQAKFMAEEDINKQISYNTELKAFAEKFAELIVKECVDVLYADNSPDYGSQHDFVDIVSRITDHFGVE